MTGTSEQRGQLLADINRVEQDLFTGPAWLRDLRRKAAELFAQLGLPNTRNEDWKYTDVAPIGRIRFSPGASTIPRLGFQDLESTTLTKAAFQRRLVFINGRYSAELSALPHPGGSVVAKSLAHALSDGDERVRNHLGHYAALDQGAFVALNAAMFRDGALIVIPAGEIVAEPIHMVFVSVPSDEPLISHPRNLLIAGKQCQAVFIEEYISVAPGVHFTNPVTELVVGEEAVVHHYKLQTESWDAFHIACIQAVQHRSSNLVSHNFVLGGALARNDIHTVLDAEGAECTLNGLFLAGGAQHFDNHTAIDHAKPNCLSRELYKGILSGRSRGVFNGKIIVRKDAQKTNALQSNKNLLLSEDAVINTKPQLEILADDVRCTHGATIGQLDAEALFYLRSRGITQAEARNLLTYAFANEILDRIHVEGLKENLERALFRRLTEVMGGNRL